MRKTPIRPGEYYHIYNRGVEKRNIFLRKNHWGKFLQYLQKYCLPEYGEVLAYCLMPNHYHLIVFVNTEDFGSTVMMPLAMAYAKAINKELRRPGHLFQGTYQAKRIISTEQLIHLSQYVHLNPVVAGFVESPEDWAYSSYREYIGLRDGSLPNTSIILADFVDATEYQAYVEQKRDEKKIHSVIFNEE